MSNAKIAEVSWERIISAVGKVRARLLRAASALEKAGIPYAVTGGNAVAAWVSRVDEAAVRNTRDVGFLLRRSDLAAATRALEALGFVHRRSAGVEMFLDGPDAKASDVSRARRSGRTTRIPRPTWPMRRLPRGCASSRSRPSFA